MQKSCQNIHQPTVSQSPSCSKNAIVLEKLPHSINPLRTKAHRAPKATTSILHDRGAPMNQNLRVPISNGFDVVTNRTLSPLTQTQFQSLVRTVRSAFNRAMSETAGQPKHIEYTFTDLDSILAYRAKSQPPTTTSPIELASTGPSTSNYDIPAFLRRATPRPDR